VFGALAGLFPNMKLTLGHVLGSVFFIPHRSPSNGEIWPVLVQGWTLNYEMFFYAVFAASLFLPSRMRLPALATVFACLAAFGIAWNGGGPIFATYTNPMILEFLAGAFIGECWLKGRIPRPAVGVALIAAALFGFAFVGTTYTAFGPLSFGPLSAALLTGVLSLEKAGAMIRARPIAYLGDSSYSIYLWHTMAISVVAKLAPMLSIPPVPAMALAVVSGTAVGVVCYELLEKPIAAAFKSLRRRRIERDAVPANSSLP
jgi:exopolysaccharide production protein ExoZ